MRRAGPGENLRVRIAGVEEEDILSGFVLSSIGEYLQCIRSVLFGCEEIFYNNLISLQVVSRSTFCR